MIISKFKHKLLINFLLLINIILYIIFCIYFISIQASEIIVKEDILAYQKAKEMSPEIAKLKAIFSKLSNNEVLLDQVLEKILEEFDKEIYQKLFLERKDKAYKIELLQKYNILTEFPHIMDQMTSEPEEYVLGFVANAPDLANYETYLKHKKNAFKGSQGKFWKDYWHGPSNFNLISKNSINFFVDNFAWILSAKKDLQQNYRSDTVQTIAHQKQIIDAYNYLEKRSFQKNNLYQDQIASKNQDINVLVEELYNEITKSDKTKQELESITEKLKQTANDLAQAQDLTIQQKQQLEAAKLQAQNEKNKLTNDLKAQANFIQTLQNNLTLKEANLSALKKQITADQKLAVEEKQRYIDNLQELEGHINVLNQKISDLNNENKRLTMENISYREQLDTKEQEITNLSQQLDDAITKSDKTKQELESITEKLKQTANDLAQAQDLTIQQKQQLEAA
ncbi:MAG: hypothetical protein Q8888_02230, partial [Vigna little leaf phytoplasma]|nr:hypothetical protein [Vigna little leaf phytoplasma]